MQPFFLIFLWIKLGWLNFSGRGYLGLFWKHCITYYFYDMVLQFVRKKDFFCMGLIFRKLCRFFLMFPAGLLHSVFWFSFFYQLHFWSSYTVFYSISSNKDEVLSVKPLDVFVFGNFTSIIRTVLLILLELIDMVSSITIRSNDLWQIVNFPTQIQDCDSGSCASLDLFLYSFARICSAIVFPPLGSYYHVNVWVSIDFPSNSKWDVSFQRIAHNFSCTNSNPLRDHLKNIPWQDIFQFSASSAASDFCEWFQVGIDDVYIIASIISSLTYLYGFQLFVLHP